MAGKQRPAAPFEAGRDLAITEARLAAPAQRNRSIHGLHAAHELAPWSRLARVDGQRIEQTHLSGIGGEGGLENVGALEVAAADSERNGGGDLEAPAPARIEQAGEEARGVEVGKAHPVD